MSHNKYDDIQKVNCNFCEHENKMQFIISLPRLLMMFPAISVPLCIGPVNNLSVALISSFGFSTLFFSFVTEETDVTVNVHEDIVKITINIAEIAMMSGR